MNEKEKIINMSEKAVQIIDKYHVEDCKSQEKREYFFTTLLLWANNSYGNAFETYMLNRVVGQGGVIASMIKFTKSKSAIVSITEEDARQVLPLELRSLYKKACECEPDVLENESRIIYDWLFER